MRTIDDIENDLLADQITVKEALQEAYLAGKENEIAKDGSTEQQLNDIVMRDFMDASTFPEPLVGAVLLSKAINRAAILSPLSLGALEILGTMEETDP